MTTVNSVRQAYCHYLNTPDGADTYRNFKRVLYGIGREDSLVGTLCNQFLQHITAAHGPRPRICDIGGGDGERITRIIRYLKGKFRNCFHLDFVEQSSLHVSAFEKQKVEPCCTVEKFHSLFEDLTLDSQSYDIVLLIHSIFAFGNGAAIEKMLSLVNPKGGAIVVVSNEANSFLGGLKQLVDADFPDSRYEIDALEKDLSTKGVSFDRKNFSTRWVMDEESNEEAVLLKWISLGGYPSFSNTRKQIIRDYLRAHSSPGKGKRRSYCEKEVVLWIPAQAIADC